MSRPAVLDICCGAGGMAEGLRRAGWDIALGVDNEPQKHYPFPFRQADAFALDWAELAAEVGAQAIHVSPVCKDHSAMSKCMPGYDNGSAWQLAESRRRLKEWGGLWVIENVPGSPMRADFKLCGCMFGLAAGGRILNRERWFETSWYGFDLRSPCHHPGKAITVAGHGAPSTRDRDESLGGYPTQTHRKQAMGIDWMNRDELAQAIPPAYGQYIGERMINELSD